MLGFNYIITDLCFIVYNDIILMLNPNNKFKCDK